jgi:hypothetical protein
MRCCEYLFFLRFPNAMELCWRTSCRLSTNMVTALSYGCPPREAVVVFESTGTHGWWKMEREKGWDRKIAVESNDLRKAQMRVILERTLEPGRPMARGSPVNAGQWRGTCSAK